MTHRWTSLALLAATAASLFVAAPAANAQSICSDTADVSWETDIETLSVTGVVVEVEGCEDGAYVGIELITDDGDVPSNGPLDGQVVDDRATFDVTGFDLRIEPVTGIRVYLEIAGEPTPIVLIEVDQRFFNPSGNEQVGRSLTTNLTLGVGQEYVVPDTYAGYDPVDCADLGVPEPDDLVAEGTGTFSASASGTHLACYRQRTGGRGGPGPGQPGADVPEVLGETIESSDDDVTTDSGAGTPEAPPTAGRETVDDPDDALTRIDGDRLSERDDDEPLSALGELSRTGTNAVRTFLIGFLLAVSGGALLRWRRRTVGTASAAGP